MSNQPPTPNHHICCACHTQEGGHCDDCKSFCDPTTPNRKELEAKVFKIVRTHKLNITECEIATDRLLQLFDQYAKAYALEIIGEDETIPEFDGDSSVMTVQLLEHYVKYAQFDYRWAGPRNNLRSEQRAKLNQPNKEK